MGFFQILEGLGNGVAMSLANKQLQAENQALDRALAREANASSKGGRKLKRASGGAKKETCTPCAAMADVDSMRKQLGYSTK